jgi:tRNA A-37 threonylcarbamoyl transferase component Bud32
VDVPTVVNPMSPFIRLTVGGVRWKLRPEWLRAGGDLLFDSSGLRIADWISAGYAEIVKSGPHRTVYHVRLPGCDFHLKHYREGHGGWLGAWLLPSTAAREHNRTEAVAARHIPTLVSLGLGEGVGRSGGSYLLTETLPDARPLDGFFEHELPALPDDCRARVRHAVAERLGRFMARLHRAGIVHRDLHPGNLLIRFPQEHEPDLVLIDLHTARFTLEAERSLPWPACRDNLVILNRWFMLRAERTDRLRFWNAYEEERSAAEGSLAHRVIEARARDMERRTLRSNLAFWYHHDARCRGKNRYFQKLKTEICRGHAVTDLPLSALAPLLADPDAPFRQPDPSVTVLKDSDTSSVVEFDLASKRVIYKRFNASSWTARWAALLRLTPALRSYVLGHGMRLRCLPTPRPLAVWHRVHHGLKSEGYLLTEKVPNAVDLSDYLARVAELPAAQRREQLRRLIEQVGRLIHTLHARHLSHRDLKAANLLVSTATWEVSAKGTRDCLGTPASSADELQLPGCVWFIDLVGVRRHLKLRRHRRVQNLTRLHASFHSHPDLTRTDKLRFLRVYLAWGLRGKGGWKRWWRQIERATQAKVRRNLRNGRPLG